MSTQNMVNLRMVTRYYVIIVFSPEEWSNDQKPEVGEYGEKAQPCMDTDKLLSNELTTFLHRQTLTIVAIVM